MEKRDFSVIHENNLRRELTPSVIFPPGWIFSKRDDVWAAKLYSFTAMDGWLIDNSFTELEEDKWNISYNKYIYRKSFKFSQMLHSVSTSVRAISFEKTRKRQNTVKSLQ